MTLVTIEKKCYFYSHKTNKKMCEQGIDAARIVISENSVPEELVCPICSYDSCQHMYFVKNAFQNR
jgi:hypothetical protein